MDLRQSDRLGTRLLALNLRHAELDQKVRQSEVQLLRLQAHLDDARLARLLGEKADSQDVRPEVEKVRTELDIQKELLAEIVKSRQDAQVAYSAARWVEAREDLVAKGELPAESTSDGHTP